MKRKPYAVRFGLAIPVLLILLFSLFSSRLFAQDNNPSGVFNDIEQNSRYIESLSPTDIVDFPVGISKTINNIQYTVAFTKAKVHSQYAELTAFAKIVLPQKKENGEPIVLFFGAEGIKFSYEGGLVGDAKLALLGDIGIPFNGGKWRVVLKGDFNQMTGSFADLTYVKIDCEGFKEFGIAADVEVNRDLLTPLDAQKNPVADPSKRVTASFQTIVKDWNDLLVSVSLPPFTLSNDTRFGFEANTAVFDFSDTRNHQGVVFPPSYAEVLDQSNPSLWRGIYVQSLNVVLPPEFNAKGSGQRTTLGTQNLIIDRYGISGNFYATNILSIGNGDANGWAMSVDSFALRLEMNELKAGGFSGKLNLPVGDTTRLSYLATISQNDYLIVVKNDRPLDFDAWNAKLTLTPNSTVLLHVVDHKFKPKAILNGFMTVALKEKQPNAPVDSTDNENKIPKLTFQALTLQTEAPYLQVQSMGYEGASRFNKFPVTITNISFSAMNNDLRLSLGVKVNIMANHSASGGIDIVGKINTAGGRQRWQYDRLQLNNLGVDADFGAFKIKGAMAILRNDPVYGDGFAASLNLDIPTIKLNIASSAIFGNVGYRYWAVDAAATFPGIPIFPSVSINGFSGGASYSMGKSTSAAPQLGQTGIMYVPDSTLGLGIKAGVSFLVGAEALCKGNIAFEMLFNKNGGINKMGFYGRAEVMPDLSKFAGGLSQLTSAFKKVVEKENALGGNALKALGYNDKSKMLDNLSSSTDAGKSSIAVQMGIEYDFMNKVLHANSEMYVDLLGGIIKGRNQGRAGWATLHIEPGDWYMHIGTPDDRVGLKIGLGNAGVDINSYFMMGNHIPGSPPPPQAVADILGVDLQSLDYMRDLNALGTGKGMAFGADLNINTGDLSFLIFYAKFNAGIGFDIMLKQYPNATCAGSSDPIGVNRWYANGQSYAYMQGELGIHVKLKFINKKIAIIKGAAAVLMQAKLPNPSWFAGQVAGNYSVLNGLVSGSFKFKVELGKACEIVNGSGTSSIASVDVIADLKPDNGEQDVDVFAAPQAAFNFQMDNPFTMDEDDGTTKTYVIKMESFQLSKNNQNIQGDLEWNSQKDMVTFRSFDVLPPQSDIKATVKVGFYEVKNGTAVAVYVNGQKAVEEKEVQFKTGTAPDYIPLTNIKHSYPLVEQDYLYPQERTQGYIQLLQGQPYLFEGNYSFNANFKSDVDSLNAVVSYNSGTKKIAFTLPQMSNSKTYVFKIVSKSNAANTVAVSNTTTTAQMADNNEMTVKGKSLSGTAMNTNASIEIVAYGFTTSMYNTFAQKIQSYTKTNDLVDKPFGSSDVLLLGAKISPNEPFGFEELQGNNHYTALVQPVALTNNTYYQNSIYPLLYQNYPLAGNIVISGRDPLVLGTPPLKAIVPDANYKTYTQQNIWEQIRKTTFPYQYELVNIYKQDFEELRYKVVNQLMGTPAISNYQSLIAQPFPIITSGNYGVELQYIFPDGSNGSKANFQLYNPIN